MKFREIFYITASALVFLMTFAWWGASTMNCEDGYKPAVLFSQGIYCVRAIQPLPR